MDNKELEELKKLSGRQFSMKLKFNPELKSKCIDYLDFLDHEPDNMEIFWYIQNGLMEQARCPVCKKLLTIKKLRKSTSSNKQKTPVCSARCGLQLIDPVSGLSKAQMGAIKAGKTKRDTIDPDTGLTLAQKTARKSAETKRNTIDPDTGLNVSEMAGKKLAESRMTTIDPDTGLSLAQKISRKGGKTRKNTIDPDTGLSISKVSARKSAETKKIIDKNSGLTLARLSARKSIETKMTTIDPATGLSIAKASGKKMAETMRKIDPTTGLSMYQSIGKTLAKPSYDALIEQEKKNGYEILTSFDEYHASDDRFVSYRHIECGEIRSSYHRYVRCLKCFPYNKSMGENEVLNFCESLVGEASVISNDRQTIGPLELDIVVPDYGLAIEYDGLYWHSSDDVLTEKRHYHLEKTIKCEEKKLNLLHIFENEWESQQKRQIWKSIIRNKLGKSNKIYARKCEIREVSSKNSKLFLDNNHLQGNAPASIRYGLYYNDELVALMTFGKSRFNKTIEWELIRYCNSLNTSVVGGASRLFKHFLRNHDGSIISYADRRHSQGGLYENLGFVFSHDSDPNYFYFNKKMTHQF
jgi:hypothetical protein